MHNMNHYSNQVVEFLGNLISGIFLYYMGMILDQREIAYFLFTLYFIDIFTGIASSIKNGVSFKSSIFSFGIFFRLGLLAVILYVYNFFHKQQIFSDDILKFFLVLVMFSELVSIRENILKWKNIDILTYFLNGFNLYKNSKNALKEKVLNEKNGIKIDDNNISLNNTTPSINQPNQTNPQNSYTDNISIPSNNQDTPLQNN